MPRIDGEALRAWRRSRGWDVPETARRLRHAAGDEQMPAHGSLIRQIRRWESPGTHELSERYELLYRRLGFASEPDRVDAQSRPALSRLDFIMLATAAGSLLDGLGARSSAGFSARGQVDAEAAEGLAHVVLGYRQIYRSAGAASLLEPVCGTLNLLTDLAPGAGRYSDLIVSLIGQAGSLAGVILMLDQGEFAAAARYLAIGARAAQQTDDDELMAITLACRAFHSAYDGAPPDGLAFATEALRVAASGHIHPQTHGWVAAVASEMHATAGHEAGCMRALDIAAEQLSNSMPAEQWKGIGAFGTAKLTAYRGGDLVRLGRYRDAQAALFTALGQLDPAQAKHRCTAYIDLADAYARDDELAEAARHAISALDIIAFTRHADSLRRVSALYQVLRPSGTAMVQDLGSRLLAVRATS